MIQPRRALLAALVASASFRARGQAVSLTPSQYAVTGNLSSIAGSSTDLLQARFTLVNCGANVPIVPGTTLPIASTKVFTANSTGNISGSLWGSDSIGCNNAATTLYQVVYLRNNVPTSVARYYRITTAFDLRTATPTTVLPATIPLAQGIICPAGKAVTGLLADFEPVCVTFQGPTGAVGPIGPSAQGSIDVTTFPGADLGLKIGAADYGYAGITVTLLVPPSSTVPTISSAVTVGPGHTLALRTPIAWNATVSEASGATIDCGGEGIPHTSSLTGSYLVEMGASTGSTVKNCNVVATGTGNIGSFFVHTAGAVNPVVQNVDVAGMGIVQTNGATNVDFTNLKGDGRAAGPGGVAMYSTDGGRVSHVAVSNTDSSSGAVLLFEADADGDHYCGGAPLGTNGCTIVGSMNWPTSVTLGHMVISDIYGTHTRFLIFHSNAVGVVAFGLRGDHFYDTGLDAEGSVDSTFDLFNLYDCNGNWCGSTFFQTRNVTFGSGIMARSDGGAIFRIKHTDPSYAFPNIGLSIGEGVKFDCGPVICAGITIENQGSPISISGQFHNATISPIDRYSGTLYIDNPRMNFDATTATAYTAIAPPQLINNSRVVVTNPKILALNAPAGSVGVFFEHQDGNFADTYILDGGIITGFPKSVLYSGDSTNVGAAFYIKHLYYDGTLTMGGGNINRKGIQDNCNLTAQAGTCP